jgi:hypothetical protein
MLKTIMSISGKPGLYKLISKGKNMLIVESLSADKKRIPAYGHEKIKEKENGNVASIDVKKADDKALNAYLAEVLPDFDRDRVYSRYIKKLISWYNILVTNGITEFNGAATEEATAE